MTAVKWRRGGAGLRFLLGFFGVLCVAIFYLGYRVIADNQNLQKKKKSKPSAMSAEIHDLELFQTDKGLGVNVTIYGKSLSNLQLTLKLTASGYAKAQITELTKSVPPHLEKQNLTFDIPFEDLSKAYRKTLEEYIPNFEKKFGVEEMVTVEAILHLPPDGQSQDGEREAPPQSLSQKIALARFLFSCQGESCAVVQSEKPDPQEGEASFLDAATSSQIETTPLQSPLQLP